MPEHTTASNPNDSEARDLLRIAFHEAQDLADTDAVAAYCVLRDAVAANVSETARDPA